MFFFEDKSELPFYYWVEEQAGAKDILNSFRRKFGYIGKLSQGVSFYQPKKMKEHYYYDLDVYKIGWNPEAENYFQKLFEAIKKSVVEGKDYLLDLVKDNKFYVDPRIEN